MRPKGASEVLTKFLQKGLVMNVPVWSIAWIPGYGETNCIRYSPAGIAVVRIAYRAARAIESMRAANRGSWRRGIAQGSVRR